MCCKPLTKLIWVMLHMVICHSTHPLERQVLTENTNIQSKQDERGLLEKLPSVVCHFSLIRWVECKSEIWDTTTHTHIHTQTYNLSSTYKETFSHCFNGASNRFWGARRWFQRVETHADVLSWTQWSRSYFLTQHTRRHTQSTLLHILPTSTCERAELQEVQCTNNKEPQ